MSGSLCQLASGDLAVSPLAAVLLEALRARATGVLEIEAGGGTSRIYFRGGHPAASQVFFGFKSFGQFLLELGWIDIDGLERSLSGVAAGKKQGEALVELGLLSEERLHLGLVLHQQAQLRTLAAVPAGTYRFQPGPDLPDWTKVLRIPAHRAIVDALTAPPGHRVVERILSRLPAGHGLVLRDGWERAAGQFELDAWEERFVGRLTRPQPFERAIAAAPVAAEKARALAACFLLMGLARPVPAPAAPPDAAPAVPARPAAPPSVDGSVGFGRSVVAPPPPSADGSVGFGRNVVAAPPPSGPASYVTPGPAGWGSGPLTPGPAGAPGWPAPPAPRSPTPTPAPVAAVAPPAAVPFDPLEIGFASAGAPPPPPPTDSAERLRKLREAQERELAEFERSRKLAEEETRRLRAEQEEADRKAREAALARPPPEFKSDPATARARRARMLRRAFGNIPGVPETLRSNPEAPPPPREKTPLPPRERTPPPPRERTPGPAAAPGSKGTAEPDPAALAARIRERHRTIGGEDYFQRLGVSRRADRGAVKRAFFEAAKLYHPDRVPPDLAHLARELKEIFTAVNEAYEVLQDEERRKAYEASLDRGGTPVNVDEQLRGLILVAETAMRHRAFADAERAYRQAATLQERPDLLAHAAWAVLGDPARRDDGPRARTELAALAASYPRTAAPHYYLGVLARSEGDHGRAERHFRDALGANPKHAQAAQELRLLEAKKRKAGGRR